MLNINITLISCLLAPTQSFRFHSLCFSTLKIQENCLPSSHCVLAVKKLLCFLQRSRCEIIKENWYVSSCQQAFASHSFYTHFSILFYPFTLKNSLCTRRDEDKRQSFRTLHISTACWWCWVLIPKPNHLRDMSKWVGWNFEHQPQMYLPLTLRILHTTQLNLASAHSRPLF